MSTHYFFENTTYRFGRDPYGADLSGLTPAFQPQPWWPGHVRLCHRLRLQHRPGFMRRIRRRNGRAPASAVPPVPRADAPCVAFTKGGPSPKATNVLLKAAAARGPCAGVRHGAQRRHASPDPIDPPGRHLRPDPLPPGRHADDRAPSRPAAGEHAGGGDAPRQQRLRHPASGGGGGGASAGKTACCSCWTPPRPPGPSPIDMEAMGRTPWPSPAKGLMGPQGTGGLPAAAGAGRGLEPLLSGGTGSASHSEEAPSFLPDRFGPGPEPAGIMGASRGPDLAGGNRHRRHPGP